jgi:protein-S-isoprenylcysteine O-methyltransferase Ste14
VATLVFFQCVRENRALAFRAGVYATGYFFVFYVLVPALILKLGHARADFGLILNPWCIAALAVCSIPGAVAALQFAREGRGTPLPLDPTRKLVTDGVYAFVRNPMQMSGVGAALVWAVAAKSVFLWVYVVDLVLMLQLLKLVEERELRQKFDGEYERYRRSVRRWIPSLRPYRADSL